MRFLAYHTADLDVPGVKKETAAGHGQTRSAKIFYPLAAVIQRSHPKNRLPCQASHVRRHGFAPVSKTRSLFQVQFPAPAFSERLLNVLNLIPIHRLQDSPVNQVFRRVPQDSSGFANQIQTIFWRKVKPDADRNHLVK